MLVLQHYDYLYVYQFSAYSHCRRSWTACLHSGWGLGCFCLRSEIQFWDIPLGCVSEDCGCFCSRYCTHILTELTIILLQLSCNNVLKFDSNCQLWSSSWIIADPWFILKSVNGWTCLHSSSLAGNDYIGVITPLQFLPGSHRICAEVNITRDNETELTESFLVFLTSNDATVVIDLQFAYVYIINNNGRLGFSL